MQITNIRVHNKYIHLRIRSNFNASLNIRYLIKLFRATNLILCVFIIIMEKRGYIV